MTVFSCELQSMGGDVSSPLSLTMLAYYYSWQYFDFAEGTFAPGFQHMSLTTLNVSKKPLCVFLSLHLQYPPGLTIFFNTIAKPTSKTAPGKSSSAPLSSLASPRCARSESGHSRDGPQTSAYHCSSHLNHLNLPNLRTIIRYDISKSAFVKLAEGLLPGGVHLTERNGARWHPRLKK